MPPSLPPPPAPFAVDAALKGVVMKDEPAPLTPGSGDSGARPLADEAVVATAGLVARLDAPGSRPGSAGKPLAACTGTS